MRLKIYFITIFFCLNSFAETEWHPKDHVIKSNYYWKKTTCQQNTIEKRLCDTPIEIIDFLLKENLSLGYSSKPELVKLDEKLLHDYKTAIEEIPESVKKMVLPYLLGVFPIKNLDGSAINIMSADDDGKNPKFLIAIDVDFLNRNANEWASAKESNPFVSSKIKVEIEKAQSNDRARSIEFILLHEFGHIIGAVYKAHPTFEENEIDSNPTHYPFSKIGWVMNKKNNISASTDKNIFPLRAKIHFYYGKDSKFVDKKKTELYRQLQKTDFVSLYASTNVRDDFAESFAHYVHEVMLHKPYKIDDIDYSCEVRNRHSSRVQYIEDLLK